MQATPRLRLYEEVALAVAECPDLRTEHGDDELVAAAALIDLTLTGHLGIERPLTQRQWAWRAFWGRVVGGASWTLRVALVFLSAWLLALVALLATNAFQGLPSVGQSAFFISSFADMGMLFLAYVIMTVSRYVPLRSPRLIMRGTTPPDDPLLDSIFQHGPKKPARTVNEWRRWVRARFPELRQQAIARVVDQGCARLVQMQYGERVVSQAEVDARQPAVAELGNRLRRLGQMRRTDDAQLYALILLVMDRPECLRSFVTKDELRAVTRKKITVTSHAGRDVNMILALLADGARETVRTAEQRKGAVGEIAAQLAGLPINPIAALQGEEPEVTPSVAEVRRKGRKRSAKAGVWWIVAAVAVALVNAAQFGLAFLIPARAPAWLTSAPLVAWPLLALASVWLGLRALQQFGAIGTLVFRLVCLSVVVVVGTPLLFGAPFEVGSAASAVVAPALLMAFLAYRRIGLPGIGAAVMVGAGFICAKGTVAAGWAVLLALCVAGIVHTALAIPAERRRIAAIQKENLAQLLRALAEARERQA